MERERPPVLGLALTNLLAAHGWKAKELADATGLASSTISAYQTREGLLTRERLEWLATFMDEVDAAAVERAVFAATVAHPERPPARTPVDPTPEQYRSIDMAAALAGREEWEIAYQKLLRETWDENAALMHEQGRALATTLKKYSEVERRDLVEDGVCGLLIARKLKVSQPTASEHLNVLVTAGLLRAKRIKQWTFYQREEKAIREVKRLLNKL